MSIYATFFDYDDETCGLPLAYEASHIEPTGSEKREGFLSLSMIPSHITRYGAEAPEDGPPWPFLRLDASGSMLLTEEHVVALRDSLSWWLRARKGGIDFANTVPA